MHLFTTFNDRHLLGLGVLLSCAALVGGGCGDDASETGSTAGGTGTPTTEATPSTTSADPPRDSSRDADAGTPPEKSLPAPERAPVKVPKSGDTSIQTFGDAASEEDYEAIATTVGLYNMAAAESDEAAMCEQLAPSTVKGMAMTLEKLAERSSRPIELDGCESVLETMVRQPDPATAARLRGTRVTDARIDDDSGFAIVRARGMGESALSVRHEDGEWKVAGLAPVPLR